MTSLLSEVGYLHTKENLAQMEVRLAALRKRMDLDPSHHAEVEHSYLDMMRQYLRDIKLYEAAHGIVPGENGQGESERPRSDVGMPTRGN
jgi:hypothetical protein